MSLNHTPIRSTVLLGVFIAACSPASAQERNPEERLLLSEAKTLLQAAQQQGRAQAITSIADMEGREVREAPAHVQVISARQIEASGARDLYDVLQLVPGITVARDVDDVIGVAVHGNWAIEGKCLFLLDGKQLNENDFGTYALGNRITLANVERVEVVLGPGSVLHGGYAALGVINIVTRNADHGTGSRAGVQLGHSNGALTRTSAHITGAHRLSRNQDITYLVSHTRGNRSNAQRVLADSTLLSFQDSTATHANTFHFNYRWKNLRASMHYMEETFRVSDAQYTVQLRDVVFGLEQKLRLGKTVELNWRLGHADQLPWYYINTTAPERLASNTSNQRSNGHVALSYKPKAWLALRIGLQGYRQHSEYQWNGPEAEFVMTGTPEAVMTDGAVFSEVGVNGKWGNLLGGYRFESNSLSGRFAAPRLAYTKRFGRFHAKAMWSKAFKTPTIMNLNYGPEEGSVSAEYVTTTEGELGVQLGKTTWITANAYHTVIDDPIVYVFDDATLDNYINRNSAGTEGFDLRINRESKTSVVLAGLGIYRPLGSTDLPEIQLPDSLSFAFEGLPNLQTFAAVSFDPIPALSVRARASYRSAMWSTQATADGSDTELAEWPSELIFNAGVGLRPDKSDRLIIDLGCNNLTDTARTLVNPMRNALTPFALNGRQWLLTLTYKFVQ